ncbi:MAG: hydroxymethylbilane synthase, partial [Eggerthellaceae bacterium]|nr:hydroxymethylbilane synthase [Eggerthellaceae bacterium]
KLDAGAYDGIVLAAAGVERLGLGHRISHLFSAENLIPAVGQGAVGLEIRGEDAVLQRVCAAVNDPETLTAVNAERQVLASLDGGCKVPMGAFARREADLWVMDAFVALPDGTRLTRARAHACTEPNPANACAGAEIASSLAGQVLSQLESRGAREVLTLAKAMVEGGEAHE